MIPSGTTTYTVPTTISNSFSIYSFSPPSSSNPVSLFLPQIAALDCGKKRIFTITNVGDISISIISIGTDTFNGLSSSYTLCSNSSIQLISDTVNNWIVIGGNVAC
jgi:hypothetical protein